MHTWLGFYILSSLTFVSASTHCSTINLGVVLPYDKVDERNSCKYGTHSAINIAIEKVTATRGPLPGCHLTMNFRDSMCSSVVGPINAIELFIEGKAQVFFGPACDFALAPVVRYCSVWDVPVLSAGGWAGSLDDKSNQYRLLTRVGGAFKGSAIFVDKLMSTYRYRISYLLFEGQEGSVCYFALEAIYKLFQDKELSNDWHNDPSYHGRVKERVSKVQAGQHSWQEYRKRLEKIEQEARGIVFTQKDNHHQSV